MIKYCAKNNRFIAGSVTSKRSKPILGQPAVYNFVVIWLQLQKCYIFIKILRYTQTLTKFDADIERPQK